MGIDSIGTIAETITVNGDNRQLMSLIINTSHSNTEIFWTALIYIIADSGAQSHVRNGSIGTMAETITINANTQQLMSSNQNGINCFDLNVWSDHKCHICSHDVL